MNAPLSPTHRRFYEWLSDSNFSAEDCAEWAQSPMIVSELWREFQAMEEAESQEWITYTVKQSDLDHCYGGRPN